MCTGHRSYAMFAQCVLETGLILCLHNVYWRQFAPRIRTASYLTSFKKSLKDSFIYSKTHINAYGLLKMIITYIHYYDTSCILYLSSHKDN